MTLLISPVDLLYRRDLAGEFIHLPLKLVGSSLQPIYSLTDFLNKVIYPPKFVIHIMHIVCKILNPCVYGHDRFSDGGCGTSIVGSAAEGVKTLRLNASECEG